MVRHNGMILQRGPQEGTSGGKPEIIGVLIGDNTPFLRNKASELVRDHHRTNFNKDIEPVWTAGDRGMEVIPSMPGFREEKIRYFMTTVGVWA